MNATCPYFPLNKVGTHDLFTTTTMRVIGKGFFCYALREGRKENIDEVRTKKVRKKERKKEKEGGRKSFLPIHYAKKVSGKSRSTDRKMRFIIDDVNLSFFRLLANKLLE